MNQASKEFFGHFPTLVSKVLQTKNANLSYEPYLSGFIGKFVVSSFGGNNFTGTLKLEIKFKTITYFPA